MKLLLRRLYVSLSLFLLSAICQAAASEPQTFDLWPKGAPRSTGTSDEDRPAITAYLPAPEENTGAAVIVVPGGSFLIRCADNEGVQVARWLNRKGIAAFVTRYRLIPRYTLYDEFQDVRRSIQFTRANAGKFRIAPDRLGVIGFSAGSHLAANAAMKPLSAKSEAGDEIERVSGRPDFLMMVYGDAGQRDESPGGLTKMFREMNSPEDWAAAWAPNDLQLGTTPSTFMYCTSEDGGASGMADLYARLLRKKIPVEAHFFRSGPHGVGLAPGDPVLGEWPNLMFNWMKSSGYLSGLSRVALRGSVKVDGQPLEMGLVVLKPIDSANTPPITIYVFNRSGDVGTFAVPLDKGPCPGRYRVEVHQQATKWVSVFKDPILNRIRQKLSDNQPITEEDKRDWLDSARKKTFTPTLDDARLFVRKHPRDSVELTLEISSQPEQELNIVVYSK